MDTTRPIIFRGFVLNDPTIKDTITPGGQLGKGIQGCVVDSFDPSSVDIVQHMEKRSEADGMDVASVFKGARRLRMAGTLYGKSRGLLYDIYFEWAAALDAVLSQREEPADFGYQPLYFTVPTSRVDDFPDGEIALRALVMPREPTVVWMRDQQGGKDTDPLAIPWQASFIMRDPQITGVEPQDYPIDATEVTTGGTAATNDIITRVDHDVNEDARIYFTAITGAAGLVLGQPYYVIADSLTADTFKVSLTSGGAAVNITTTGTGIEWARVRTQDNEFVNRGRFLAIFNALFVVGPQAGTITVTAGDSTFVITVPASTGERIIRYNGNQKVLTIEEEDTETLAMSAITFTGADTHPLIPSGESPYTVTPVGVVLGEDSHMWFYEPHL